MEHVHQQQQVERNAFRSLLENEAVRMNCAEVSLRSIANSESHTFQRMLEFENQQSALHLVMAERRSHEATLTLEVKEASEFAQFR